MNLSSPPGQHSAGWTPVGVSVAAITLVTAVAFWPVTQAGFLNWDDPQVVVENPFIRGLGGEQLAWMFGGSYHTGHYHPLTWLSLALDYRIWGLNPLGFHLTNLLLHLVNAGLVFWLGCVLYQRTWHGGGSVRAIGRRGVAMAGLAALLFAVHPLRVESVAWITERRDLLSACFLLLGVLAYLASTGVRNCDKPFRFINWRWATVAWLLMGACLLSKAVGVMLPLIFLTLDFYPLKRFSSAGVGVTARRAGLLALEKIPFFILAVPFALIALRAQEQAGALQDWNDYPLGQRMMQAVAGLQFYIEKTVWPAGLSALYDLADISSTQVAMGVGFTLSGVVVAVALVKRLPSVTAAWIGYVVLLMPVLGFAQSGQQAFADRYSYLACLGPMWLAVGGIANLLQRRFRAAGQVCAMGLACIVVIALAWQTHARCRIWHDSVSLWSDAVATSPGNSWAQVNLGDAHSLRNNWQEAATAFGRAVELDPTDKKAHNGLAVALLNSAGRGGDSDPLHHLERAVEIDSDYTDARLNLAWLLAADGRDEEAITHYRTAIATNPDRSAGFYRLGLLLMRLDRDVEAVEVFGEGVERHPDHLPMAGNLAWTLATSRHDDIRDGQQAIQLALRVCRGADETDAYAYETLAAAYAEGGMYGEAIQAAQTAMVRASRLEADQLMLALGEQMAFYRQHRPWRE